MVWQPSDFTGGWSACLAIESADLGMAWAVEALDSYREGDDPLAG